MRKLKNLFWIMLLGHFSLNASETKIGEWFQRSWEYSPDIRSAEAQVEVTEAQKTTANSLFYPKLFGLYQYRDNEAHATINDGAKQKTTKVLSLNASANVFNGLSDYYGRDRAYKLLDAQKSAFSSAKLSVARTVADTLLALAATSSQKVIYDENSVILDRRYDEFKHRTAIGKLRDVDLIQNQIDRLKLERSIEANNRDYATAVAKLMALTGQQVGRSPFSLGDLLKDLLTYHSAMDKKSYQREQLRTLVAAQNSAVKAAYGAYLPTVTGVASLYPRNNSHYSNYEDNWSVGFDLQWTFFNGFSNKAAIDLQKAQRVIAESNLTNYEITDNDTQQTFRAQWSQLAAERKLLVDAEALAVKEFKAQERDFKLGLVTVLELSTSDEQYLNLKLERVSIDQQLGQILSQSIERGGMEGLVL